MAVVGQLTSLALALLLFGLGQVVAPTSRLGLNAVAVLHVLAYIDLLLGLSNLVLGFPLDGGGSCAPSSGGRPAASKRLPVLPGSWDNWPVTASSSGASSKSSLGRPGRAVDRVYLPALAERRMAECCAGGGAGRFGQGHRGGRSWVAPSKQPHRRSRWPTCATTTYCRITCTRCRGRSTVASSAS